MDLMTEEERFCVKTKIVVVALGSILNVSILLESLQVYGIALTVRLKSNYTYTSCNSSLHFI